jgi:GcrA cell cycle regulator
MTQPTWADKDAEKLRKLHGEGLTSSQIADALGVTRNAVMGKINRLGLLKQRAPRPKHVRIKQKKPQKEKQTHLRAQPPQLRIATPPVSDQEIPIAQRRTLLELTQATCRWPIGDPGRPGFFFCGAPPSASLPYCTHHAQRAYLTQPRRAKPFALRLGIAAR